MNESALCDIEVKQANAPVHSSDYWIEGRGENNDMLRMSETERLELPNQFDKAGAVWDLISMQLLGWIVVGLVFGFRLFYGDSSVNCPP